MPSMSQAQELLAAGDPEAALAALQQQVRADASDVKLRIFLFQLLSVLGQWERALTQLEVCGEMDASTLAMVNTYRPALQCEGVREAVLQGRTTPHVFGRPAPWVALLVEALRADAQGRGDVAAKARDQAFDEAPATSGTLDGVAFDWIADADSRLGPVLEVIVNGRYGWMPFSALRQIDFEAPSDLRDLVWSPAHLQFVNGGETVALVPVRYAGPAGGGDAALRLARRTDWEPLGGDHYRGIGQRVLATSAQEVGLLQVRSIVMADADAEAEAETDAGSDEAARNGE
jgi:type VI secretion system protein ImpE